MPATATSNTLYYGDNLSILREYVPDNSVDLVYLDPPFNSNRNYNVLFRDVGSKSSSPAQIEAFEDTWHWGDAAQEAFEEVALRGSDDTARLLKAMVDALGRNDVTAYLSMMAIRLVELRRVLKSNGSIYLHCDPTAGHYLKVLMDSIFGPTAFINQVVWKRSSAHSDAVQGAKHYGRLSDLILVYSKSIEYTWNTLYGAYDDAYVDSHYNGVDSDGRRYRLDNLTGPGGAAKGNPSYEVMGVTRYWRYTRERMDELIRQGRVMQSRPGAVPAYKRYLDEMPGVPLGDVWTDVFPVNSQAKERLGYPTQKPLPLLERVIATSSNKGDVVLDPFCGCGTAVHAAEKLDRRWIGIDITHLAIGLIRRRMEDAFPALKGKIRIVGVPQDLPGAEELARRDPYQFQWWAIDKVDALPTGGERKKGMDRGIDGVIPFLEGSTERRRVIVSVKSGHLTPAFVRDLKGVIERETEPIGVLLTLKPSTREMRTEALAAGHYRSETWKKEYPRIQILTAADLLNGKKVQMSPQLGDTFAQAGRERAQEGEQAGLDL